MMDAKQFSHRKSVVVGAGTVRRLPGILHELGTSRSLLVADKNVSRLHGSRLLDLLQTNGQDVALIEIASGESAKSLQSAEKLYDQLAERKARRGTPILALGGGVTTDLVGFVASTYMRGVPLVLIPTTLLAQADAAIGGKTGINLSAGKNLVGTFYPATCTLVDFDFLKTLPEREIRNGLAEVIKMCMLGGEKRFRQLEKFASGKLNMESLLFRALLHYSITAKMAVVRKDPKEMTGQRAVLNLGHTFAHGLEAATGYKVYTHGEAVAIGLVAACLLSESVTGVSSTLTERVESVLAKCGLPVRYTKTTPDKIIAGMAHDKKRIDTLRFVLPLKLGKVELRENIPEYTIMKVLEEIAS